MSKETFGKNLEAMEKWYPDFADMIRNEEYEKDETEVLVETSWDGEKIFRVKKEEQLLYLGGKRNAKKTIKIWSDRMGKIQKYAPVFLFGVGSGAYLKALIHSTDEKVNVVVYEPSLKIFLTMLEEIDLSEEIENRPIAFVVKGINEEEFEPVLDAVLVLENLEFLKEEIHPNYKHLFGEELLEKVKPLHQKMERMLVNYNTERKFSINLARNVMSNMAYICEGYHTKTLSKVIPYNYPAILVSAGPSLNKNIQELKKAKNKAFILAVDTAIKPLLKSGIIPDAFITIDANKPLDLINIEGAEKIPVIAPTCAMYEILNHQKGKKIFYNDQYILPYEIYNKNGLEFPTVSTGGSVACSGLSLLYKMGFTTIVMVGQDLAFTDNKSHADGTFETVMPEHDTEGMMRVKGNYEDTVPTRRDFRIFIEWFEKYIEGMKEHRDVRVINATEGGAYIKGTELMILSEAIEEFCGEEVNFFEKIEHMESEFTPEEHKKNVEYLHGIPKQFEETVKEAKLLQKQYKKIDKLARSGKVNKDKALRELKKVKKHSKKISSPATYQLISVTMPVADYIIQSEYYYEEDSIEKALEETARKGLLYSELVEDCAGLLKEMAEMFLLPIE